MPECDWCEGPDGCPACRPVPQRHESLGRIEGDLWGCSCGFKASRTWVYTHRNRENAKLRAASQNHSKGSLPLAETSTPERAEP